MFGVPQFDPTAVKQPNFHYGDYYISTTRAPSHSASRRSCVEKLLGWKARYPIDEGIRTAIEWGEKRLKILSWD